MFRETICDYLTADVAELRWCDRHGHELASENPAITLKGGNMQIKARVSEETPWSCPTRDQPALRSQ